MDIDVDTVRERESGLNGSHVHRERAVKPSRTSLGQSQTRGVNPPSARTHSQALSHRFLQTPMVAARTGRQAGRSRLLNERGLDCEAAAGVLITLEVFFF